MKLILGSGKVCQAAVTQSLENSENFWHLGPVYYGRPEDAPDFWRRGDTVVDFVEWVTTDVALIAEVVICIPEHPPLVKSLFRLPSVYLSSVSQCAEWLEVLRLIKFTQNCGFESICTLLDENKSVQSKCVAACIDILLEDVLGYEGE